MTQAASSAGPAPFSPGAVLGLLLAGTGLFVAVLWLLANGAPTQLNNGGQHGAAKGVTGYAAMAAMLEASGTKVTLARTPGALRQPGLLVLTPPSSVDVGALSDAVSEHLATGPVLLVLPKWISQPANPSDPGAKPGWVRIVGEVAPDWPGFHDEVRVKIDALRQGRPQVRWSGAQDGPEAGPPNWQQLGARLPFPDQMQTGDVAPDKGSSLHPLVSAADGRVLAGELFNLPAKDEDEDEAADDAPAAADNAATPGHALVIVFEPDLLNNYGLSHADNAPLAEALLTYAMTDGAPSGHAALPNTPVTFDLTLNGLGRKPGLLNLVFSPPYLGATLALLLAAVVVGWRAFCRFGPRLAHGRDIALGKAALVDNSAALVLRSGRLRLLPGPYVDAARHRIAAALGLPRNADTAATDAAIDRSLAARAPDASPFSQAGAALLAATNARDMLRAAQTLHAIERKLTR
jgi:hypothetical protein